MTEYFTRDGAPFPAKVGACTYGRNDDKTGFGAYLPRVCGRCGGLGGSDKWKHTGWTCYDCGGSGKGLPRFTPAYTREQLDRLNAAQAKAQATRQRKAEAKRAQAAAEADARRDTFMLEHNGWFADARKFAGHVPFVADVLAKAEANASITDGQIAAVNKVVAREREAAAYREQARHLGEVGDKVTVEGRLIVTRSGRGDYGDWYFAVIKDARGMVVFKGSTALGREDDVVKFVATVKACEYRDGQPQTVVSRPRKWELVEEGKYRRMDRLDEERFAEEAYLRQVARMVQEAGHEASREGRPMCRISDRSEWPKPAA